MDSRDADGPPIAGIPGIDVVGVLGRGSGSVVYQAQQHELNRNVALKVLAGPDPTGDQLRRFRLELLAMGRLSRHPAVVPVYWSGTAGDGRPYVVMQLMLGGPVAERVRQRGRWEWRGATAMVMRLCGAAEAAHRARILHGDIKPENVLLTEFDEAKLAGFGAPPFEGRAPDVKRAAEVSPAHAAPEVLAGGPSSVAADVYALASTLYFMLTGRPPFHRPGESAEATLHRASNDQLAAVDGQQVPDVVMAVIARALAADPERRPAGALAFARELQRARLEAGEAAVDVVVGPVDDAETPVLVTGGPVPARRRRRRRFLRRRVWIPALLVILLGGGAGGYVLARAPATVATNTLARWYNPAIPDRWETTSTASAGYVRQQTLGFLPTTNVDGGHAVYGCLFHSDHFLSADPNCEGYSSLGLLGYVYATPPGDRPVAPLYRCWTNDHADHFVSNDPYCEGQILYGLLGYALQSG